jgi:hypothetical protein
MNQIKCMSKKWGGEAIKVLILIRLTKFVKCSDEEDEKVLLSQSIFVVILDNC